MAAEVRPVGDEGVDVVVRPRASEVLHQGNVRLGDARTRVLATAHPNRMRTCVRCVSGRHGSVCRVWEAGLTWP